MKRKDRDALDACDGAGVGLVSRRVAMGWSGVAVAGLLGGSAWGRQGEKEADRKGLPREMQEMMERSRAFSQRMREAGSAEERMKIMAERNAWERQRTVEAMKDTLGFSDREWTVVKPRIEKVYNLTHPQRSIGPGGAGPRSEVQRRSGELREVLRDEEAKAEAIKAKLTALRAAKEKARRELAAARQDLRQLMTLRQEAHLVLRGLLD